jgi:hypothetical protein
MLEDDDMEMDVAPAPAPAAAAAPAKPMVEMMADEDREIKIVRNYVAPTGTPDPLSSHAAGSSFLFC